MDDLLYMRRALELAARGDGFTSPNPAVGAVVVQGGRIVGEGWHEAAGLPHAEVLAIDDAGDAALGASLYVTLEPCHHTGQTPPCTQKIIEAGISRVVMAMRDPNPNVIGGGAEFLESRGIIVQSGICEPESRKLNECFIKHVSTGLPFVVVKCAATLDGRIAARTGDSKWITGPASRQFAHQLRSRLDSILVGVNTIKIDDPSLTTRLDYGEGKNPLRIVLDSTLSIPDKAKVLNPDCAPGVLIAVGPHAPAKKISEMKNRGVEILICPLKEDRIDLKWLMGKLGEKGVTGILIEGGSRVIGTAFSSGVVDKFYFYYAPKILGDSEGYPMIDGKGGDRIADCLNVSNIEVHRFDNDIMIEGYPDFQNVN
jgi:diaminohydroxyphosphoribosylaminopyrimidine deaminase / 5-amino-6-(5-phosphoribosylamino)uracil reductase